MLGILLYISTIGGVPHSACIFIALYALFDRKKLFRRLPRNVYHVLWLYFIFILGATFNVVFSGNINFPYVWLMPLIFIVAYALDIKDIKWLILLSALEGIIGLYELYIGTDTILPWVTSGSVGDSELMYFNKVKGISDGSATYTIKLLIALVLLNKYRSWFSKSIYYFVQILLFIAIIMCFSRTVLVAAVLFKIITAFLTYYKKIKNASDRNRIWVISGVVSVLFVLGILFGYLWKDFIFQFSRGGESIDLSGRDYIWKYYLDFIRENLLFGNGSTKLLLPDGKHAHNSYLQLVANNGLLLSLLFITAISLTLRKRDYIYVLPFFILSAAQYALFWGFSYTDVILAFFLFNRRFDPEIMFPVKNPRLLRNHIVYDKAFS